jgi:hypothetical protein
MQDAVAWVEANNPNHEPVFYNESRMRYYAGEKFIGNWNNNTNFLIDSIDNKTLIDAKWLLITSSLKHNNEKIVQLKLNNYRLIRVFKDQKQKKFIMIYVKK